MKSKIYLFGTNDFLNDYTKLFQKTDDVQIVGASNQETMALKEIAQSGTDFVIYYLDGSSAPLRVAQQIYMLYPQYVNVAISDIEYLQNNMVAMSQSGIHYSFSDSDGIDYVTEELNNIKTIEENRMASFTGSSVLSTESEIYTFYGPKGGMGKSTVVVNTAIALAKQNKKVLILDFDLQFGDIATITGIDNKETLSELLQEQGSPSIDVIRKYIAFHKTGINILCAPKNLEYAEKIDSSQIEKIISSLRTYYDYIFIDLGTAFDDILLSCCEQSNRVLLFVRADISTLKCAKQCLDLFESLSQTEKIELVSCDIQKNSRISNADVSRVLGFEVKQTIPFDIYRTTDSINRGNPIIVDFPNSGVSKSCEEMASRFSGKKGEKKQRKLFARG